MKLDTDRAVGLSAMFVGVCSLFITLYQTHLTRQAQSASVLPYLAIAVTSNDEGTYVTLRNDGVGPARIEDIRIHYRGKDQLADPYDFFLAVQSDAKPDLLSVDKVTPGRFIPAGATVQMLGTSVAPARGPVLGQMLRLFALAEVPKSWLASTGALGTDKAVIDVTYTSVYGDRWRLRSDQLVPRSF
jgi:hypothetical protein